MKPIAINDTFVSSTARGDTNLDIQQGNFILFFIKCSPQSSCCFHISCLGTVSKNLANIFDGVQAWALGRPIHSDDVLFLEKAHDCHDRGHCPALIADWLHFTAQADHVASLVPCQLPHLLSHVTAPTHQQVSFPPPKPRRFLHRT